MPRRVRGTEFAEKATWSSRIPLIAEFWKNFRPLATNQPCGLRSFDWVVSYHPIKNNSYSTLSVLGGECNLLCDLCDSAVNLQFTERVSYLRLLKNAQMLGP
jgi:hypothetical protein